MNYITPPHKQQGLSIVELMIAIAIGLIITAAVSSVYISSKSSATYQNEVIKIQENGRLATDLIGRSLMSVSFQGCASLQSTPTITSGVSIISSSTLNTASANYNLQRLNFAQGIDGVNNVSGTSLLQTAIGTLPTGVSVKPGTDILAIYGTNGIAASVLQGEVASGVIAAVDLNNNQIRIEKNSEETGVCPSSPTSTRYSGFCPGDIVLANNCRAGRIFEVTSITNNGTSVDLNHGATGVNSSINVGNNPATWTPLSAAGQRFLTSDGAEVSKLLGRIYFVGTDNKLYVRESAASAPVAIIDSIDGRIEDLQVTYGISSSSTNDRSPNCFLTADRLGSAALPSVCTGTGQTANWSDVMSVKISFVIASNANNIAPVANTFNYKTDVTNSDSGVAAITAASNDKRLRRVYSTTITLRNRNK